MKIWIHFLLFHWNLSPVVHSNFTQYSLFYPAVFNSKHLISISVPKSCFHISSASYCIPSLPLRIIFKIIPGLWLSLLPHSPKENMTVLSIGCKMIAIHPSRCIRDFFFKVIDNFSFLTWISAECIICYISELSFFPSVFLWKLFNFGV